MDVLDEPAPRIAADQLPEILATHWGITVDDVVTIVDGEDRECLARLITTVPGTPLEGQVVTEDLPSRSTRRRPGRPALPSGIHHADVTLTNLLVTDGRITGVIDFGDMQVSSRDWRSARSSRAVAPPPTPTTRRTSRSTTTPTRVRRQSWRGSHRPSWR